MKETIKAPMGPVRLKYEFVPTKDFSFNTLEFDIKGIEPLKVLQLIHDAVFSIQIQKDRVLELLAPSYYKNGKIGFVFYDIHVGRHSHIEVILSFMNGCKRGIVYHSSVELTKSAAKLPEIPKLKPGKRISRGLYTRMSCQHWSSSVGIKKTFFNEVSCVERISNCDMGGLVSVREQLNVTSIHVITSPFKSEQRNDEFCKGLEINVKIQGKPNKIKLDAYNKIGINHYKCRLSCSLSPGEALNATINRLPFALTTLCLEGFNDEPIS